MISCPSPEYGHRDVEDRQPADGVEDPRGDAAVRTAACPAAVDPGQADDHERQQELHADLGMVDGTGVPGVRLVQPDQDDTGQEEPGWDDDESPI